MEMVGLQASVSAAWALSLMSLSLLIISIRMYFDGACSYLSLLSLKRRLTLSRSLVIYLTSSSREFVHRNVIATLVGLRLLSISSVACCTRSWMRRSILLSPSVSGSTKYWRSMSSSRAFRRYLTSMPTLRALPRSLVTTIWIRLMAAATAPKTSRPDIVCGEEAEQAG